MSELAWNQFKHSRRRWLFSCRLFYSKIWTLLMSTRLEEAILLGLSQRDYERVASAFAGGLG